MEGLCDLKIELLCSKTETIEKFLKSSRKCASGITGFNTSSMMSDEGGDVFKPYAVKSDDNTSCSFPV